VLHSAGSHEGISTDITQLIKDVRSRIVLLHENSVTMLVKQQIHHLQKYCHSGLWIKSHVHVMNLYLKLQITYAAISHITPSQVVLIKCAYTDVHHYLQYGSHKEESYFKIIKGTCSIWCRMFSQQQSMNHCEAAWWARVCRDLSSTYRSVH
jgi:hypothetical protein